MTAAEYLKENSDWFDKSPGGEKLYFESEVIKMMEKYSSQTEISDSTIIDQIDGIIFQLPFDDKIKLWKLIEKLVEENRTEISDEEIEKWVASTPYYGHCTFEYKEGLDDGAKWYREQLKQRQ